MTGNDKFDIHSYEINISTPEGVKQAFFSVQRLTKQELDNKKVNLQNSYNWTPFKGTKAYPPKTKPLI